MMNTIRITGETDLSPQQLFDFIKPIFDEFIAPDYEPEGVEEFYDYISPKQIEKRTQNTHRMLFVTKEETLVGLAEFKNHQHLSMLFITPKHQRQGIGTTLLKVIIEQCRTVQPTLKKITVNSAPSAVTAYRCMGFKRTGKKRSIKGIRFVPMTYTL
jgi:GNAT superfamily N-acetyltransferase